MPKRKRKLLVLVLTITCLALSIILHVGTKRCDYVFVEAGDLGSMPGVGLLAPNWSGFEIIEANDDGNQLTVNWKNTAIHMSGKCRVKRRDEENLQVAGGLKDGKEYPVVIDSGFPGHLDITDTIVVESGLEIYPAKGLYRGAGGLCHLCELRIGDLTIVHAPCTYRLGHYERRLFGRTIWTQKQINLGLGLMRQFAHILIDNVAGEVEFSAQQSFEAEPNNVWTHYPMTIEPDEDGQEWLAVDIPIAGSTRHVRFDTGVGSSLLLAEKAWAEFLPRLRIVKKTTDRLFMLHGFELCKKITVNELAVGTGCISGAVIDVVGNDNPWGDDFLLMGLGAFQKTLVVLDFERSLIWVRNSNNR